MGKNNCGCETVVSGQLTQELTLWMKLTMLWRVDACEDLGPTLRRGGGASHVRSPQTFITSGFSITETCSVILRNFP